jgi:hypothetical protein
MSTEHVGARERELTNLSSDVCGVGRKPAEGFVFSILGSSRLREVDRIDEEKLD